MSKPAVCGKCWRVFRSDGSKCWPKCPHCGSEETETGRGEIWRCGKAFSPAKYVGAGHSICARCGYSPSYGDGLDHETKRPPEPDSGMAVQRAARIEAAAKAVVGAAYTQEDGPWIDVTVVLKDWEALRDALEEEA